MNVEPLTPGMRVQIIRNQMAVYLVVVARIDTAANDPSPDDVAKAGKALSQVASHLTWLETNGHLREFQELLMAETAGVP
jgi:hypothetical protein